jgi:hypothetical protein
MAQAIEIKEHMEVLGSDGKHVGIVVQIEQPERIKLAKQDPKAEGRHHFIPLGWVDRVDVHVHLNKSSRDAMAEWQAEG